HRRRGGLWGLFNRGFGRLTNGYTRSAGGIARRAGRMMIIYLILAAGLGYFFLKLPSGFVPNEDQGFVIVGIQGPPEASSDRTAAAVNQVEAILRQEQAVEHVVAVLGFGFSGSGPNSAIAFVKLKDWAQRGPEDGVQ